MHLFKSMGRRLRFVWLQRTRRGSVLIGLIVTMVVLAALGATMLPLTNTATINQVEANSSARAYFLAESGYRYAAGQYSHATDDAARDEVLRELHAQGDYRLPDGAGAFHLEVYPFFFKTRTDPEGTLALTVEVTGGFSKDLRLPASGRLKIGTAVYEYVSLSYGEAVVIFNMADSLPSIPAGSDALFTALSAGREQTLTEDGTLELQTDDIGAFPPRNGTFQIGNATYSYRYKDATTAKLIGIHKPGTAVMTPVTLTPNTSIVLAKFIQLVSIGTYGSAAVERKITYHVPLPLEPLSETAEFRETFATKEKWTGTKGTHVIEEIAGNQALRVTSTDMPPGTTVIESQIVLDSARTPVDLARIHTAAGGYLGYDAQVKIGFVSDPVPGWGFDPPPIPLYYAAGLTFRLDDTGNSYGLSFLRGSNVLLPRPDNIDDGQVPLDQRNLVVLWQRTGSGQDFKWLAYKNFAYYSEGVENGSNGWTTASLPIDDLWHITAHKPIRPGSRAWYFGRERGVNFFDPDSDPTDTNDEDFDYDLTPHAAGALTSPPIDLSACSLSSAWLRFMSWYETDGDPDLKVQVSTDGTSWQDIANLKPATHAIKTWKSINVDLSAYVGSTIQIRFYFDATNSSSNNFEGWYVDDITIGDFPNESTLALRLQEGATLGFKNGGSIPFVTGEKLVGLTSGARGRLTDGPLVQSGGWNDRTAVGQVLLTQTTASLVFIVGESVRGTESGATGTVQSYRARDNYIRAFYGYPYACGVPDGDYTDEAKAAVGRGAFRWPPARKALGTPPDDYFTLIQWEAINPAALAGEATVIPSLDEPGAVIRSNTLLTAPGPFSQAELALHTFGKGSTNVYFDDFALKGQIEIAGGTTPPIQE